MPLTPKGKKILQKMQQEEYGEAKGKAVFYASRTRGRISGVDVARGPVARSPDRRRRS